jgi:hypothetical protein
MEDTLTVLVQEPWNVSWAEAKKYGAGGRPFVLVTESKR